MEDQDQEKDHLLAKGGIQSTTGKYDDESMSNFDYKQSNGNSLVNQRTLSDPHQLPGTLGSIEEEKVMPNIDEDDDQRLTTLSIQDKKDESIEQPLIVKVDEDKDKEEGEGSASGSQKGPRLVFGFGQIGKGAAKGSGTSNVWSQLANLTAEEVKTVRGQQITANYRSRRNTVKFLQGEGGEDSTATVSHKKMLLTVDLTHPRMLINGHRVPIPLCADTGSLRPTKMKTIGEQSESGPPGGGSIQQMQPLDELGLAVSIYFKLLKSVVLFFIVAALFSSPVYYIYSQGGMTASSTTSWLSYFTLGNIGQTQWYCAQTNILSSAGVAKHESSLILQCPGGSNITELLELGLAKTDWVDGTLKATNNTCPNVNTRTEYDGIHLELDPECSWTWDPRKRVQSTISPAKRRKDQTLNQRMKEITLKDFAGPPWPAQEQTTPGIPNNKHSKAFTKCDTVEDKDQRMECYGNQFYNQFVSTCHEGFADTANTTLAREIGDNHGQIDQPYENAEWWPSECVDKIKKVEATGQPLQVYARITCTGVDVELNVGLPVARNQLALLAVGIDLCVVFAFLFFLWHVTYYVKLEAERHRNLLVETQEFALEFTNLPKVNVDYSIVQLKADLWHHIEAEIKKQPQQMSKLAHTPLNQACEIVDIQFAMSNYKQLDQIVDIQKLMLKVEQIDQNLKKTKAKAPHLSNDDLTGQLATVRKNQRWRALFQRFRTKEAIEKQIAKEKEHYADLKKMKKDCLGEIDELRDHYYEEHKKHQDNYAISAMVTFRSMEGFQRGIAAFDISRIKKVLMDICCSCCFKKNGYDIKFQGRWLRLKKTVDPELILWENFAISRKSKCLRRIVFGFVMVLLLAACFYSVFWFEKRIYDWEKLLPDFTCSTKVFSNVSPAEALADYKLPWDKRNGDWHCYCSNAYQSKTSADFDAITFDDPNPANAASTAGMDTCRGTIEKNGVVYQQCHYCDYWNTLSNEIFWLALIISLVMGVGDVIIELFVQFTSQFTKPKNETKNLIDLILGITWIQFVNFGFILMLMSLNFDIKVSENGEPRPFLRYFGFLNDMDVLAGAYSDFNQAWYAKFGEQIVRTMCIQIGTPHIPALVQLIVLGTWRCWDRGCSRDKSKSRQIFQQRYEHINIGPEFVLDVRLAQVIACTFVTFMFSSAMPVLYILMAVDFTLTYWVDKALLLRFYRSPKNFDDATINFSLKLLKLALVFHFMLGYFMLGNQDLLASPPLGKIDALLGRINDKTLYGYFDEEKLTQTHMLIFLMGFLLVLLLWICESTIFLCLNKHCYCCRKYQKAFEKMDAISDDYYDEIHLKFLLAEYDRAKLDKLTCLQHMIENKEKPEYLEVRPLYNSFVKTMIAKEKTIESKISQLCQLIGIDEPTVQERIRQLKLHEDALQCKKSFRMKSKVQSYDLRDCEEYYGILELEKLLLDAQDNNIDKFAEDVNRGGGLQKQYTSRLRMRMNMAGERDTEASGLLSGGGAYGAHPSEVSALKESDISYASRPGGSAAVSATKRSGLGKSEIEEEEDGKNSFSKQMTIFQEAGIMQVAQKSNRSNMSSIVSSEGQDSAPQATAEARLPSIFAEEVGERQPFDPLYDEIDHIVPGGGRRRSATATLAPSRITDGSTDAVKALPRAVLRAMESLHDAIVKEMDAEEPPEQDEEEGAELPGTGAHLRLRHARTNC